MDAIACYRLTRLATADVITRPARVRVIRFAYRWWRAEYITGSESEIDAMPENDDDAPKLADFVRCRYCTSIYLAAGVLLARRYAPRQWDPIARLLTLSAGAALIAGLEQ